MITYRGKPILSVVSWRRHGSGTDHAHTIDPNGSVRTEAACGATSESNTDIHYYDHEARTCSWCRRFVDAQGEKETE